ncbi:hypothetical protein DL93DRAFT_2093269 [Clavulina sp. PMI_390]|nr:hypothetical protein DL93DRAFT_2093269 [Clavulina sp. PMI_390]
MGESAVSVGGGEQGGEWRQDQEVLPRCECARIEVVRRATCGGLYERLEWRLRKHRLRRGCEHNSAVLAQKTQRSRTKRRGRSNDTRGLRAPRLRGGGVERRSTWGGGGGVETLLVLRSSALFALIIFKKDYAVEMQETVKSAWAFSDAQYNTPSFLGEWWLEPLSGTFGYFDQASVRTFGDAQKRGYSPEGGNGGYGWYFWSWKMTNSDSDGSNHMRSYKDAVSQGFARCTFLRAMFGSIELFCDIRVRTCHAHPNMIAELILMLAGHPSSLFIPSGELDPAFEPYLHPGERASLEYLARIALRYRRLKSTIEVVGGASEYLASMCSAVRIILKEYEALVVTTESRVLHRDDEIVASGSFVPLASLKAIFSEWDAPMAALHALLEHIQSSGPAQITPGQLIDLLLERKATGVARIASIMSELAVAVQEVWRMHLIAYLVHGSLSPHHPFALLKPHRLNTDVMPKCINAETRDSIFYIGRAIMTVQAAGSSSRQQQLPRSTALTHAKMLSQVLPADGREFEAVIANIRSNISEWLWTTVLTRKDVDDAIESFANFFLMRNGEFGVSLIREIERLKKSRLTPRASSRGPGISVIREQDLALALLRASLGTTAQYDPSLSKLKFTLPTGPHRPFLTSLDANPDVSMVSMRSMAAESNFTHVLLGTPLELTYTLTWPLDLFLTPADLRLYTHLFAYFSAIRHTHQQVMNCWTTLSNSQRARRRWVGIGEGGDLARGGEGVLRRNVLRCGWGVVREMLRFLDALWGYICIDVVEPQYRALRTALHGRGAGKSRAFSSGTEGSTRRKRRGSTSSARSGTDGDTDAELESTVPDQEYARSATPAAESAHSGGRNPSGRSRRSSDAGETTGGRSLNRPQWSTAVEDLPSGRSTTALSSSSSPLDFATLRTLHSAYLYALSTGSLLANAQCAETIKAIMELCVVFVGTIERWGSDILPGLLEDGSLGTGDEDRLLKDRWRTIRDVNESLIGFMETFHDQLISSLSSHAPLNTNDATTTAGNTSTFFASSSPFAGGGLGNISTTGTGASGKARIASLNRATDAEVRRTVERLLLRLDFNGAGGATAKKSGGKQMGILQEGGL